ncbi:MAG: hypothetical protein ACXW36_08425 [Nitrospira sp.]
MDAICLSLAGYVFYESLQTGEAPKSMRSQAHPRQRLPTHPDMGGLLGPKLQQLLQGNLASSCLLENLPIKASYSRVPVRSNASRPSS